MGLKNKTKQKKKIACHLKVVFLLKFYFCVSKTTAFSIPFRNSSRFIGDSSKTNLEMRSIFSILFAGSQL